jgi:hypothetical protein
MTGKEPDTDNAWVDPDEAPELDDGFFERADLYDDGKLIRPGKSRTGEPKVKLDDVWLSPDVAARLQAVPSWQTVLDSVLLSWLDGKLVHKPKPDDAPAASPEKPAEAAE